MLEKDNELLNKIKLNIAVENLKEELPKEHLEKIFSRNKVGGMLELKKKVIGFVCICFIIFSGVCVGANYEKIMEKFERGLGNGIDKAVDNGYIQTPNMNYIESETVASNENSGVVIEGVKIDTKIKDFLMDDLNISTQFEIKINEDIDSAINLSNLKSIDLKDLIVTDENKKILFCMDREIFEEYCKENNLPYEFTEFNENVYNCGLNNFIQRTDTKKAVIDLQYNMYTDGEAFPNSKTLYFKFTKLILTEQNKEGETDIDLRNKAIIQGDWEIKVDVPRKMYERTSINYKVLNIDNKDCEVYNAKVSDTGFEIGVVISNIKKPENFLEEKRKKIFTINEDLESGKISKEEAQNLKREYAEWSNKQTPIAITDYTFVSNEKIESSYVENSKGKKFYCTLSPGRRTNTEWLEGDKYDFYETFGLTKYDMTDKIKVVLFYYNSPITIELQKDN